MRSSLRFAGIITVVFVVCGLASAQEIAPASPGVTINKMTIDSGPTHTVKYFVQGGSPRLQALVRRVEWTENELSVIEQLQLLKLDTVVNDRRVATFRTGQLTNPFNPSGLIPFPIAPDHGGYGQSPLQRALTGQLAWEATPQVALQMIGFLEQQQTELDAELKALPPQEQQVIQGPIDALRPRVAALQPAPPVAGPVAVSPAAPVAAPVAIAQIPPQTVPQLPTPQNPVATQQTVLQSQETMRQQILQMQRQMMQQNPWLNFGLQR
jgi:hypothetical protein